MGALARCLPPTRDVVKFGVVRGPSSDHSGLGSTPKLNFSVIVTPACAVDTETEVLVAWGTPERGLLPLVGHVSACGGRVFLQVLVVLGATTQRLLSVAAGNIRGGVVPRPANEGGRTAGPGLHGGGLLCGSRQRAAGRVLLRTCGRCESGGWHRSGVCRNK